MTHEIDPNDIIITDDEYTFGGRLEPHQQDGAWFIRLSLPNGKERLTAVPSERDAIRLIDETLDLFTRVVVLRDGAGELVLEGTVYDVGTWLDCEHHDGGNVADYSVTDKCVTVNGRTWLGRVCFEGEAGLWAL